MPSESDANNGLYDALSRALMGVLDLHIVTDRYLPSRVSSYSDMCAR